MVELGQLETAHEEFENRKVRVVVASIEDQDEAQATKADFPHLIVVADSDRALANAVAVVHEKSDPEGGDTAAPTTLVVDGHGTVRWTFRSPNAFRRLSPAEVLEAVDKQIKQD